MRKEYCYGFRGNVDEVRKAIAKEMSERGWKEMSSCFGGIEQYSELTLSITSSRPIFSDNLDVFGRATVWYAPEIPGGYTCLVFYEPGHNWLQRKWVDVRRWLKR